MFALTFFIYLLIMMPKETTSFIPSHSLKSNSQTAISEWSKLHFNHHYDPIPTQIKTITTPIFFSAEEEILDQEEEEELPPPPPLPNMEKAWRFVKKPMLRLGSKGAAPSHGNSLRELLEQHDAVKVKINTRKLGTLEEAFDVLQNLAVSAGAPKGIELLQTRNSDNTILVGKPGMMERIENGLFPPPPPSP